MVGGWTILDRLTLVLIGVAIAVLMWRYASIRAVPTRQGLVVRNLFTTRRLAWPQIVRVQFGGGAPWVTLDLDDTDTVAVMAIQKADGASAGPRPVACPPSCRSTGSAPTRAERHRLTATRGSLVSARAGEVLPQGVCRRSRRKRVTRIVCVTARASSISHTARKPPAASRTAPMAVGPHAAIE